LIAARRALVTGGSRGIGRAVAEALALRGWQVTVIARDQGALEQTLSALAGEGHEACALDVTDESAWARLSPRLQDLHGLVCVAAVLEPIGPIGSYAINDFRRTLDVNVTGTLLAIKSCLPSLLVNSGAVVTFSGGGATSPLRRFDAYAASKVAVVRLSENIAGELARQGQGVRVNCVAPGFVATEMHRTTLEAGPELVGETYYERTRVELEQGGVPASEAAELTCLLLEREPDAAFTGKLISAQWDDWRSPAFRARLAAESDLATLRRIDGVLFGAIGDP